MQMQEVIEKRRETESQMPTCGYDVWELCPSQVINQNGILMLCNRMKQKCVSGRSAPEYTSSSKRDWTSNSRELIT